MPGGPQPVCHRLPNPAALVRAVDQNKILHRAISLSFLDAHESRAVRDKAPLRPSGGRGRGPARQRREDEVGGATILLVGPPHPALSPRPAGGEGNGRVLGANFDGAQFPPVTSIVTPVTK